MPKWLPSHPLLHGVLLGLLLFVTGRLSLQLAIPPGVASPIWPPAGIAMAGMLVLGWRAIPFVFLASCLLNYVNGIAPGQYWNGLLALQAAAIAFGSTLQTALAVLLCRRWVNRDQTIPALAKPGEVLRFFLLCGALACIIAPTVGVGSLVALGAMPFNQAAQSWLAWWLGDALGVIVVCPLMLCLMARQHEAWRGRLSTVAVPLLVTVLLLVAVTATVLHTEQARLQRQFDIYAETLTDHFYDELTHVLASQRQLADLFRTPDFVSKQQFSLYTLGVLQRQPEIRSIFWAPRIAAAQREQAEMLARQQGLPDYRILEPGQTGPRPAALRSYYDPVWYIEPLEHFAGELGQDQSAGAVRRQALAQSHRRQQLTASARLQLPDAPAWGVLIVQPVDSPLGAGQPLQRGMLGSLLNIDLFLERSLSKLQRPDVPFSVLDLSAPAETRLLSGLPEQAWPRSTLRNWQQSVSIGERSWQMVVLPTRDYVARESSWLPWVVLTTGLIFTALLTLFLLTLSARTALIAAAVEASTAELADSNRLLLEENLLRQQTEAQLRAAAREAQAANVAKSQFLANMSHEIRTPMNGVVGMAQLLGDSELSHEQREQVLTLRHSAESLLVIINDILDYSKIEAGKLQLVPSPFEPEALVREVMALYQPQAEAAQVGLALQTQSALPVLLGDPVRVRQIVGNLLSNGIKFSHGGQVNITLGLEADGGWLIRISDTGIGMNAEVLQQLFAPFYQAEAGSTRRFGGTGLGLSISKSLVEMMGGRIEVSSTPGAGATFEVRLPLPQARLAAATPGGLAAAPPQFPGLPVLVVDDNLINQKVAGQMLKKLGATVSLAGNGEEALSACRTAAFALILMDCQMPVMDGLDATRALRQGAAGEHYLRCPIIAMTANAMSGDREACLAAGMDDFLPKPVVLADLAAMMARLLPAEAGPRFPLTS
ncbi:ATP-binding protein [Chitinilyticum litopenaei]|uniref:ATP-binding protein n=1 Tax=Chitinilyticum litopenaei TaxID=1121276 RepID=UPI0003F60E2C|nr:ATP-binding protein [Chitinilyticum litopenaei]